MAQRKGQLGNLSLNLNQLFSSAGTHIGRTYLLAALQQPERDVLEESCNIIVNIILWATFIFCSLASIPWHSGCLCSCNCSLGDDCQTDPLRYRCRF